MNRLSPGPEFTAAAPRPCPLCGGAADGERFPYGTRWNDRLYRNLACAQCGAAFLDPVPTAGELAAFYSRADYHDQFYALEEQGAQTTMLRRALPLLNGGGTLLDFGCGNGHFLAAARAAGFDCTGVEVDQATCALATRNSGCPVWSAEELAKSGAAFDVIHLGDVLEHLPDPAATCAMLERHLAPGGRFFFEGPLEDQPSAVNLASRGFGAAKRLSGRRYGTYQPLHLFRATASAQRRFFAQTLGHRILGFWLADDGWPYAARTDSLWRPRSAAHAIKLLIARTSQWSSRAAQRLGLPIGNRFAAVTAPAGQ